MTHLKAVVGASVALMICLFASACAGPESSTSADASSAQSGGSALTVADDMAATSGTRLYGNDTFGLSFYGTSDWKVADDEAVSALSEVIGTLSKDSSVEFAATSSSEGATVMIAIEPESDAEKRENSAESAGDASQGSNAGGSSGDAAENHLKASVDALLKSTKEASEVSAQSVDAKVNMGSYHDVTASFTTFKTSAGSYCIGEAVIGKDGVFCDVIVMADTEAQAKSVFSHVR